MALLQGNHALEIKSLMSLQVNIQQLCWLGFKLGENNIFINTKIENKLNGLDFVLGIKWQNFKDLQRKIECLSFALLLPLMVEGFRYSRAKFKTARE